MGTIPSRREDRGLTPLWLRAWISVSAAASAFRKYVANSGIPEHNGFSTYRIRRQKHCGIPERSARQGFAAYFRVFGLVPFVLDAANT